MPYEAGTVTPEIESLRKRVEGGKATIRLSLAFIEAGIGRGRFEEAQGSIQETSACSSQLFERHISEKLFHVRTLIASPRIAYLNAQSPETIRRWKTQQICVWKFQRILGSLVRSSIYSSHSRNWQYLSLLFLRLNLLCRGSLSLRGRQHLKDCTGNSDLFRQRHIR